MMKRILCLLLLANVSFQMLYSQQSRLKKLTSSIESLTFSYDAHDRIVSIVEECDGDITQYAVIYEENIVKIEYNGYQSGTRTNVYHLTDGRLTRVEYDWSENYYANMVYDGNRLSIFDEYANGKSLPWELIWQDGNVAETKRYRGSSLRTHLIYTYNDMTTHPLVHCIWGGLDVVGWPDAFVFYRNMGTLPKNLMENIEDASGKGHRYDYAYETNSDGNVVHVVAYYDGKLDDTYLLEWENANTGVEKIQADEVKTTAVYYSLGGSKLYHPQHGLNIVQISDGTYRKVIVR